MFCSHCGKEIQPGTKFCPACGADVSAQTQVTESANKVFQSAEGELTSAVNEVRDTIQKGDTVYAGERLTDNRGLISYILLSIITCGLYSLYWEYKLGNRLAANAPRYGMTFQENGTTVLLWRLFGALLCFVGTFVGTNILINNSNKICNAYNRYNNL